MKNSHAIQLAAWRFFITLRIGFFVLVVAGATLIILGNDYGIFALMLGGLLGYASAFRPCTHCGKHIGWVGILGIGFTTPFLRKCAQCGHRVRRPEA